MNAASGQCVAGMGRYCVFQDPAGAFAALYESQPA